MHLYGALALSVVNLVGLDPFTPPRLPEYDLTIVPPPLDEEELTERRNATSLSYLVAAIVGVFSSRGVTGQDANHTFYNRWSAQMSYTTAGMTPLDLNVRSALLMSRVDDFNRMLTPNPPGEPLLHGENEKTFAEIEREVDRWCQALGLYQPTGGMTAREIGEILGAKVLAEQYV